MTNEEERKRNRRKGEREMKGKRWEEGMKRGVGGREKERGGRERDI
jgi:hypothetical protein